MGWLSDMKNAAAVQDRYDDNINKFLYRNKGPSASIIGGSEPLERLFQWVEGILRDNDTLGRTASQQSTTIHRQEKEIERLSQSLARTKSDLTKTSSMYQDLDTRNRTMMSEHKSKIQSLKARHGTQLQLLQKEFKDEITKKDTEIKNLLSQLMVNQDEDRAWADSKIKQRFQDVQRLIESITSPNNSDFLLPNNKQPGSALDPTKFISRTERAQFHFLLRSKIWEILRQQFFSEPYGFGAFGMESAQSGVLDVYFAWQKMFGSDNDSDDYAIFHSNRLANNLRSATFQCLSAVVLADGDQGILMDDPLCNISRENVSQTVNRILDLLSEAAKLSNNRVRSEVKQDVRRIVDISLHVALQFGVQPAQLQICCPERGDRVRIGSEFHDCADSDLNKGKDIVVDLVVVPGLQKIGNGRSSKELKRAIIPCEIYPQDPGLLM